jgi:hypothetical protein
MRYMMFIKHGEDYDVSKVPQSLFGAMDTFVQESIKAGTFIDGAGLQPTKAGTKIRLAKGKLTTTDGPFTEAKEVVGGFAIMDFETREEALKHCRKFMEIHKEHWPEFEGECEMRPFELDPTAPAQ